MQIIVLSENAHLRNYFFFLKNLHTQLIHKQVGDVEVGDCFGQSNLKMIVCFFLGDSVVL